MKISNPDHPCLQRRGRLAVGQMHVGMNGARVGIGKSRGWAGLKDLIFNLNAPM